MATPRSLLRTFLVNRFSDDGALRRFVDDYFAEVSAQINWQASLVVCAECLISTLSDRGMSRLWPALNQERTEYRDDIRSIEEAWKAAATGNTIAVTATTVSATVLVDRPTLHAIFRAARDARLENARPALLIGVPEPIVSGPPLADARAQLLVDLDRLNRLAGDPPPLRLWLENAELLQEDGENGATFSAFIAALPSSDRAEPEMTTGTDAAVTEELAGIVLQQERPAFLVTHGRLEQLPQKWSSIERSRSKVEHAIAATGRFDTEGAASLPWIGSGAVVGEDLVCTAKHMTELFYSDLRKKNASVKLLFDPRRDELPAAGFQPFEVSELLLAHPVLDLALVRVPGLSAAGIKPLVSSSRPPEVEDEVVRVTYVAQDSRVDIELQRRLFRDKLDGAKWVLPGRVMRVPAGPVPVESPNDRNYLLEYDTNTLGGTSGPVIDVATGQMLGISLIRMYLFGTWAVPAWQMIRDPRIRDLGVVVPADAPPPDDPWASAWKRGKPDGAERDAE